MNTVSERAGAITSQKHGESGSGSTMSSSEKLAEFLKETSSAEEAARLLLSCGFAPDDRVGQVRNIAAPHRAGRTLGSVWREMRRLVQSTTVPSVRTDVSQ